MEFNKKIEISIVDEAINNCISIDYPVAVTCQGFGDDLASALEVIKTLVIELDKTNKVVSNLLKARGENE